MPRAGTASRPIRSCAAIFRPPTPAGPLITCKTEPQYRVDQCELVDEWPNGAGMGRAVLAAAWQFKVRPPQKGGRALVGEWVRIRISYQIDRK